MFVGETTTTTTVWTLFRGEGGGDEDRLCKQPRRTLLNSTFLWPLVLIRTRNVSINPKPCLPASLPSWFLSVDMKRANDVVQGRKHLKVVEGNEMLFSRHSNWMLTHGLHFIFGCSVKN